MPWRVEPVDNLRPAVVGRKSDDICTVQKPSKQELNLVKHVVIQIEACQIVQDYCLAAKRAMPAGTVDTIVTSPPYDIGVKYRSTADTRPRLEPGIDEHRPMDRA